MDTIQKQIHETTPSASKRFFNFVGKKKVQQKDVQHLEGQLKELSSKLQQIDQDFTCHINKSNEESVDLNQNKKVNVTKTLSEPKDVHIIADQVRYTSETKKEVVINRTNSLTVKSTVKNIAQRTSKSVKNKSKALNGSTRSNGLSPETNNGNMADSSILHMSNPSMQNFKDSYEEESEEDSLNSDSFTDLTSDRSPVDDNVFNPSLAGLSVTDQSDSHGTRYKGSNSHSITSSPRKEVHPDIMAEIEVIKLYSCKSIREYYI